MSYWNRTWGVLILAAILTLSGCSSAKNPVAPLPGAPGGGGGNSVTQTDHASPAPAASATPVGLPGGGPGQNASPTTSLAPAGQLPAPVPTRGANPTAFASRGPVSQEPFFYLSYDDSASTAAVELTKYSLQQGQLPNSDWARPWEFFNYEPLATSNQASTGLFQVGMGLWQHPDPSGTQAQLYDLGVHVASPAIDRATRRNLVLTAVVDVSGSMSEQVPPTPDFRQPLDKLGLAKLGLETLTGQLKAGDVISIVIFSERAATILDRFAYDGTNLTPYLNAVQSLATQSSTNLNAGLEEGYRAALAGYDATRINRVIMLTDAYANVGEVDPRRIAARTRINNTEGIYFSGVGFGADFNEAFLNELTEAGKGAYFSIVTPYDARRSFNERFMSLVNVAARNVQFRLDFPGDLIHQVSAAEQVSLDQSQVQSTNFSYNSSQYFLESFASRAGTARDDGIFKLTITYTDSKTGAKLTEVYEQSVQHVLGQNLPSIKDAYVISLLTGLMKGDRTELSVQKDLATLLVDHRSSLATEYRGWIDKWITLASGIRQLPPPIPVTLPGYCNGSLCVN